MNSVDLGSLGVFLSHGHDFVLIKLFRLVASFFGVHVPVCVRVCVQCCPISSVCVPKEPGVIFAHTLAQFSICRAGNAIMYAYHGTVSWNFPNAFDFFFLLKGQNNKGTR